MNSLVVLTPFLQQICCGLKRKLFSELFPPLPYFVLVESAMVTMYILSIAFNTVLWNGTVVYC